MSLVFPGGIQRRDLAGDVAMTLDQYGGGIVFENGAVVMTSGFKTAAILALAGGNEDDPGTGDASKQWWGNIGRPEPETYRSATGFLLASIPPTSNGLKRIQAAVNRDLAFFTDTGAASEVEGAATMPALSKLAITGRVRADGPEETFNFTQNWRGQADELAGVDLPYSAGSRYAFWADDGRDLFADNFGRLFLMGG